MSQISLEGRDLNTQGNQVYEQENYEEAENLWQQALEVARDEGDRELEAGVLNNLGLIRERLNENQRALELYQQSLRIFQEENTEYIAQINILGKIGQIYYVQGRYPDSIASYETVLNVLSSHQISDLEGEELQNVSRRAEENVDYVRLIYIYKKRGREFYGGQPDFIGEDPGEIKRSPAKIVGGDPWPK